MLSSLAGYRTYLIAALIGVLAAAKYLGYVDETTFQALLAFLTGGGLAALRSAVGNPVVTKVVVPTPVPTPPPVQ